LKAQTYKKNHCFAIDLNIFFQMHKETEGSEMKLNRETLPEKI